MRSTVATLGIVLMVGFVGCEEASVTDTPDEAGGDSPSQTQAAQKATVGSPITLQGNDDNLKVRVTVVSVANPANGKDEFHTPEAGNKFVGIQLRLENVGTIAYDDSPGNGAKLIDGDDQQYDEEIASEITQGQLLGSSVTLAPGSTRAGWMVFQLPDAATVKTFQMSLDSGFASQTGEWAL
jgi:hypothetical protein